VRDDLLEGVLIECREKLSGFRRWSRLLLYLTDLGQEDLPLMAVPAVSSC